MRRPIRRRRRDRLHELQVHPSIGFGIGEARRGEGKNARLVHSRRCCERVLLSHGLYDRRRPSRDRTTCDKHPQTSPPRPGDLKRMASLSGNQI